MDNDVKVSVCVVTYNQEEFIEQCLRSLVEQETDFKFEVIVSDDCSTDGTIEILERFYNEYPDVIKPFFQDKNIGPYKNYHFAHKKAVGKYIAHVDGDDYALPGKLQNQSDFLDVNPNCNIAWHPMKQLSICGGFREPLQSNIKKLSEIFFYKKDILELMSIGIHSSKMYRKKNRDFLYENITTLDYFLNVEHVGSGYAAYSSTEVLGVYRTGIGISSATSGTKKVLAENFIYFSKKYPDYRININTAALTCMLIDLKNLRPSTFIYLKAFVKTFSFFSIVRFFKVYSLVKTMRV